MTVAASKPSEAKPEATEPPAKGQRKVILRNKSRGAEAGEVRTVEAAKADRLVRDGLASYADEAK